jgi:hypothetical protein
MKTKGRRAEADAAYGSYGVDPPEELVVRHT